VKPVVAIGILLLVGCAYAWYWIYSRGAFKDQAVEAPITLQQGAPTNVRFFVAEKGDHNVEIDYPSDASRDVGRSLARLSGRATLMRAGEIIAQVPLPSGSLTGSKGHSAMALFTISTEPSDQYSLSLDIHQIPQDLAGSRAIVRVYRHWGYGFIFLELEWLAMVSLLAGMFCIFPAIRVQALLASRMYPRFLIRSLAATVLGYAGLMLPQLVPGRLDSTSGWTRSSMVRGISFALMTLGSIAVLICLVSWLVVSVLGYFRTSRAGTALG
jgi:hypothetical protein